jgi:hypothetical protein
MKVTQSYNDLCKEIEVLEVRIDSLESERNYYTKLMWGNAPKGSSTIDYSIERVKGDKPHLALDKVIERLNKIDDSMYILGEILSAKQKAKLQIEKAMSEFEGLEYKVAYKRDIEGKPLHAIADELGYSYDWIRKMSSKVKKAQRVHKNIYK